MMISIEDLPWRIQEIESRFLAGEYTYISLKDRFGVSFQRMPDQVEVLLWIPRFDESTTRAEVVAMVDQMLGSYRELEAVLPSVRDRVAQSRPTMAVHHDYGGGSVRICELQPSGELRWIHPYLVRAS